MCRFKGFGILLVGVAAVSGCRHSQRSEVLFSRSIWNPFGLELPFAADTRPVRIGLSDRDSEMLGVGSWWDLSERVPWSAFRRALSAHLGRPVQCEELKPFQVAAQLASGRLDFALLSEDDYRTVSEEPGVCQAMVRAEPLEGIGLVVASAKSDIMSMEQIQGRRFAFGPRRDPILHYAAVRALRGGGVPLDSIKREIVPPDTLQFHISSREVAKEVAYGLTAAGVIDRAEYEQYPDTGGRLIPLSFGKDQFRVLGETKPVDLGPFVASRHAEEAVIEQVRSFLLDPSWRGAKAYGPMGLKGFTAADARSTKTAADRGAFHARR